MQAKLEGAGLHLNGTRKEQISSMHAEIQRALQCLVPKVCATWAEAQKRQPQRPRASAGDPL